MTVNPANISLGISHFPVFLLPKHPLTHIIFSITITSIYSGAPRAREARAERSTMGKKIW